MKGQRMRLDIYRRAENGGKFSYLAVPEARLIPGEAISTDWLVEAMAVEVPDDAEKLPGYAIEQLSAQLEEKGYAMTALQ
jgi:hypothetical protein